MRAFSRAPLLPELKLVLRALECLGSRLSTSTMTTLLSQYQLPTSFQFLLSVIRLRSTYMKITWYVYMFLLSLLSRLEKAAYDKFLSSRHTSMCVYPQMGCCSHNKVSVLTVGGGPSRMFATWNANRFTATSFSDFTFPQEQYAYIRSAPLMDVTDNPPSRVLSDLLSACWRSALFPLRNTSRRIFRSFIVSS